VVLVCLALAGCGSDEQTTPDGDTSNDTQDVTVDSATDVSGDDDIAPGFDAAIDVMDTSGGDLDAALDTGDLSLDMGPVGSLGCTSGSGLAEGEHTFVLEQLDRRYILRLPTGYTADRAWPLVLALHPNGSDAGYWDNTSGPRNIRGVVENDAILVIVEAIGGNWRDYSQPDLYAERIDMELAYFDQIIDEVQSALCIDLDAQFAMGFSGGGSFSGLLGCRRTDIRAFAAGGAVIYFDEANCVGHPAAWITIGVEELNGREPFRDWWRDYSGCEASTMATDPSPCVRYDGCAADTPVNYCEHPGDHVWPDFGSQAVWDFFQPFTTSP